MPAGLVETFRNQGFVHLPAFYDGARMDAFLSEIRGADPDQGAVNNLSQGGLVFYSNLFRKSAAVRELLAEQRLLDVLAPIAGPDLWVRWDQAVAKLPGAGVFPWHQDNGYNQLLKPHVQVWIAASDSTPKNGGLMLVPGSHRLGLLPHRRVGRHQEAIVAGVRGAIEVEAAAGDVVLFSSLMLHCTGPNEVGPERWAYVAEFMPLADYDPFTPAPFFVVAERGASRPRFAARRPGSLNLLNRLLYAEPRATAFLGRQLRKLRGAGS